MVLKIILNLLGIIIFFLGKFLGRKNKTKATSIIFWLKDNLEECILIFLVDISIMILLLSKDVSFDMTGFIPSWLIEPGDLTAAWLIGLALANLVYKIIQKKVKSVNP